MPQPLPYMNMWWSDYDADTSHLTTVEHGAYLLLIKTYWQTGGALPDSDKRMAAITRLGLAEWREIRPELEAFFTVADGHWHHRRIDREIAEALAKVEKARNAGKASGNARRNSRRTGVRSGFEHGTNGRSRHVATPDERTGQLGANESESESEDREGDSSPSSPSRESPVGAVVEAWNAMAEKAELPTVVKTTEKRRAACRERIRENGLDDVLKAIALIPERPFLLGNANGAWKADFDWLCRPNSVTKILEGTLYLTAAEDDDQDRGRPSGWRD